VKTKQIEHISCQICKKEKNKSEVLPAELVRGGLLEKIKCQCPEWNEDSFICIKDLNKVRDEYLSEMIKRDRGELTAIEAEVAKSLNEQELLSMNTIEAYNEKVNFGQKVADKIAMFGGSWKFIGIFAFVIIFWISVNSFLLLTKPFDPFPFILLNLILSCLAAIQAPVIMMSQNRQEEKDRLRAEYDYKINLKAELEIRLLHEKIDHLLHNQWQRLLEIQEMQTILMEQISEKRSK